MAEDTVAPVIMLLREYHSIPALLPFPAWDVCSYFTILYVAQLALGVFRENKGSLWFHVAHTAAARYIFSTHVWTPWELKSELGLTTAQTYEAWARRTTGVEALTDELPRGAKLHWVGPRRVDRVILYFHGAHTHTPPGVFAFPCLTMVTSGWGVHAPAREEHFDMLLTYGGISRAGGLRPAELRTPPSNLILTGDSAGGNLALQTVAQLLHPHPSLPSPPVGPLCLGWLLLLSPWMEFRTDAPSYTRNAARDVLPLCMGDELRAHPEPAFAAASGWWRGLGRVTEPVLVVAGEHEALLDRIEETARVIAEEVQDTTVFILPRGVHDDLISAFGVGEGREGEAYRLVVSWVAKTLEL
ncbi:hypothetical protein H4582DRAFT_2137212 [Lactarius indigo]|nr:hypothetical protein H4582DRAFT_2137212 [Lactarius indigo]